MAATAQQVQTRIDAVAALLVSKRFWLWKKPSDDTLFCQVRELEGELAELVHQRNQTAATHKRAGR